MVNHSLTIALGESDIPPAVVALKGLGRQRITARAWLLHFCCTFSHSNMRSKGRITNWSMCGSVEIAPLFFWSLASTKLDPSKICGTSGREA